MEKTPTKFLAYQRARFMTHLPMDYLYSPSHVWVAAQPQGVWRVGFTKFATRMLGEMVDHGFQVEAGTAVQLGQIIGWVEGFKAISDLFCVLEGTFMRSNAVLKEQITLLGQDPYQAGWLYEVKGQPDTKCVDVHGYQQILDKTIDRLLEKQAPDAAPNG